MGICEMEDLISLSIGWFLRRWHWFVSQDASGEVFYKQSFFLILITIVMGVAEVGRVK